MAIIKSNIKDNNRKILQGDYVYCEADTGSSSFWGIYSSTLGKVISLDGAGSAYVEGVNLKLYDKVNHWRITKIIKCENAILTIEEKQE